MSVFPLEAVHTLRCQYVPYVPLEAVRTVRCLYVPYVPWKLFIHRNVRMSLMSLGSCSYTEMSVCPLSPQGAIRTVRCPDVPYVGA